MYCMVYSPAFTINLGVSIPYMDRMGTLESPILWCNYWCWVFSQGQSMKGIRDQQGVISGQLPKFQVFQCTLPIFVYCMIPFPVPIWVCIHKYTIQSYTINIHTDINTPNFSTWQCAGRSRLSSLQMTNLLMISAHEGLRLPVRSFSFSPSLFFSALSI